MVGSDAGAGNTLPGLPVRPEDFQADRDKTAVALRSTRVHSDRASYYALVYAMAPGEALPASATADGWMQNTGWIAVTAPNGHPGWVDASTVELRSATENGARYTVAFGQWRVDLPESAGGPRTAAVRRLQPGRYAVTITGTGLADPPVAVPGQGIVFPWPRQSGVASIQTPFGGTRSVALSAMGVLIHQETPAGYRVIAREPGRLVVEVFAGVTAVTRGDLPTGQAITIQTTGPGLPETVRQGDQIAVSFAGAELASTVATALPAGVRVEQTPAGAEIRIASRQAWAMRRTEQAVQILLYSPGLKGKTIVLDPGHGGPWSGATGINTDVAEKDLNLAVAQRLKAYLEAAGARVFLTRTGDNLAVPLSDLDRFPSAQLAQRHEESTRVAVAAREQADLFLSIHHNSAATTMGGTETFWTPRNGNPHQSRKLAGLVQAAALDALDLIDRGVKSRQFLVITYLETPAALLEVAFLNNPEEEAIAMDPAAQDRTARHVADALTRFFDPE